MLTCRYAGKACTDTILKILTCHVELILLSIDKMFRNIRVLYEQSTLFSGTIEPANKFPLRLFNKKRSEDHYTSIKKNGAKNDRLLCRLINGIQRENRWRFLYRFTEDVV
jgi:hypothetical protein